jgi:cardiolipin synthase
LRNRTTIQNAYLRAMHYAKKSILLANPYFAPNWKLRNALVVAAARGVDVTLLIGVGQFGLQDAVTHAFYPSLLKSGVKLVEYRKTQLHAKVAVVDDEWATVGSSNYDGLSLFINQEANIVIQDAEFSQTLRLRMQQGIADGVQVRLEDYARIPRYKRMWYGMVYVVYRSLMWVVTLGNYV